MSYRVLINSVDISDYVVDMTSIPIYNHNLTGEPVSEPITIKIHTNNNIVINEDDEVEIKNNNISIWLGYVIKEEIEGHYVYKNITALPLIAKLKGISVASSQLEMMIRDCANWNNARLFNPAAVDVVDDIITIGNHGFETGDIVTVRSAGQLPGGLNTFYQYEVGKIDNNRFKLIYPISGAPGSGEVDLTSQGTSSHYITNNIDFVKFVEWDNAYLPNVSIEWLLKSMFRVLDCELIVENPQYPYGQTTLNATNVALDLNMLKVLGYGFATNTPTDDDRSSIIDCYELLQRLTQIFGWRLVYYGVAGYKKYALQRAASYTNYYYSDYVCTSFNRTRIFNTNAVVYGAERFAPVLQGTSRQYYTYTTKTDLVEHNRIVVPVSEYAYPYINNLKILLRETVSPNYHHILYINGMEAYITIHLMAEDYKKIYDRDYMLEELELAEVPIITILNKPIIETMLDVKNNCIGVRQI